MVNRINPIHEPNHLYKVKEVQDDDQNKQEQQQSNDDNDDGFNKLSEKTDWKILFHDAALWNKRITVSVEDIKEIQFLNINLKTDPSLLQFKIILKQTTIPHAFVSVPRKQAMVLKNHARLQKIEVSQIAKGRLFSFTVPQDKEKIEEEITRIEKKQKEQTVSYVVGRFMSHQNWLQKLRLQDPVTGAFNKEIVTAYLTIVLLLAFFVFGLAYLAF